MSVQVGGEGKKRKDRIIRVWSSFFSLGSDPICCSFLTWFGHDFPAGQFVSVRRVTLSRLFNNYPAKSRGISSDT